MTPSLSLYIYIHIHTKKRRGMKLPVEVRARARQARGETGTGPPWNQNRTRPSVYRQHHERRKKDMTEGMNTLLTSLSV